MTRTVVIDEEGCLTLPENIIEKYRERFRVVERDSVIELEPIQLGNDSDN